MNILITGANGQLGNEMRMLSTENAIHKYFFTDMDELDITDEQFVRHFIDHNKIDMVVNCAGFTAVDAAEDNPEAADKLNNLAPGYLAAAAQSRGAGILHISTDYVFDGTNYIPYTESEPTRPASVYGITKLAGEQNVLHQCEKTAVIRTSWLYSSYGNNFVKTMIRLGHERKTLGVVSDQVGTPTYANDLACAIFSIIDYGIIRGIYHYSNEGVCSWYDFTKAIHRIAGITGCKVNPIHTAEYPVKAPRPPYSVLDKTKIKQTYGIEIPHWEESLENCVKVMSGE